MLLMMSLATFSQTGTSKTQMHCFPDSVVKKIAKDLVRGDSARTELTETKILVEQLEEKNSTNQRLINAYVAKVANYTAQIDLYQDKETQYKSIVTGLEQDNKKLKKKQKRVVKIITGIAIAGVATSLLVR